MSPFMRALIRPALNTTVAAAAAGVVVLSGTSSAVPAATVRPQQTSTAAADVSLSAATTTTARHHRHKHHGFSGDWRARVLRVAQAQTGDPYRYGGSGPSSFDCSGLTAYAYRVATGKHLPHNAAAQQGSTHRISARSARPGDLVFFHDGGSVYHVGIYVGHHTIIHAPYPGQHVKRERIWTSAVSYGRVA